MRIIRVFTIIFVLTVTNAMASPAAWYIWKSKLNQLEVCSQTSLGEGWEKWKGPYMDAQCSIIGKPG